MRTFALGDLHGNYRALKQVLERSEFNKEQDRLIFIGDIADGLPEVRECVEELLTIKNRIDLLGNHDDWFITWLNGSVHPDPKGPWVQGGKGTVESYLRYLNGKEHLIEGSSRLGYRTALLPRDIPAPHRMFFRQMVPYYYDPETNFFYVHAGFDRKKTIQETSADSIFDFIWDRDLWNQALSCGKKQKLKIKESFAKIFIGHTAVFELNDGDPVFAGGLIWNIDTSAGWNGRLTLMNVDTEEFWQSDLVQELYPLYLRK